MNENPRFLKLLVLLVGMTLLATAFGTFFWDDESTEFRTSPSDEVIQEEMPEARGTRSPALTTRSVLAELFTGTWCMYCPGAEGALDTLANEYPQTQLSILEYHIGPSIGAPDPYEVPGNYNRAIYYGVSGYPTAVFDGIDSISGGSTNPDDPGVYNNYKMRIENRLFFPSPVTITLNGSLGGTTGTITANITTIDRIPMGLTNIKARFVVYEDHNYSVYMGYEYRLRYTVVVNLPEESITLNPEESLEFTKTFPIDPFWELDKIGACVFVQADSSKEVLQATSINLSSMSSKVDLAITSSDISFSNPAPYETQVVTIYATVHNVGTITTPSDVYVRFYDKDPTMGGNQIGAEQNAGIILSGGSSMVQVDWDTTGYPGDQEIVVVVDPMFNIDEPENENNNKAPKYIYVDPGGIPQVDYIRIKDASGNGGNWIGDTSYLLGDTDTFWAGGYNISIGWVKDVDATWSSDFPSIGDVGAGPSTSTTFSTLKPGTCKITADYGGLINTTGVLTIFSYEILKQGWNLISLPLIQGDPSPTKVLESIDGDYDAIQCYDITDLSDPWKHHKVGKPFGNDINAIDETMSFWVHITQPGDTIFLHNGAPAIVNQNIDLYTGWNLVGYPSLTSYDRTQGLNTLTYGTEVDSIWSYDPATQTWNELGSSDYFEPGTGYWVHATTTCVWEVPV